MNGVVLWSDQTLNSAVIWCEDHGDLAFFNAAGPVCLTLGRFPDAGDYVSFDVEVCDDIRIVRNPRAVAFGTHPGLAQSLRADRDPGDQPGCESRSRDNLVRLSDHRSRIRTEPCDLKRLG